MPRVECYVDDTTYLKLLQMKQNTRKNSMGKTAAAAIKQFFSIKAETETIIARLNAARDQMQEQYENKLREMEYKLRNKSKYIDEVKQ